MEAQTSLALAWAVCLLILRLEQEWEEFGEALAPKQPGASQLSRRDRVNNLLRSFGSMRACAKHPDVADSF
jgi:hypothetical protein